MVAIRRTPERRQATSTMTKTAGDALVPTTTAAASVTPTNATATPTLATTAEQSVTEQPTTWQPTTATPTTTTTTSPANDSTPTSTTSTSVPSVSDTLTTLAPIDPTRLLSDPTLPLLADTATLPPPHRTEGFPWGHASPRPGVIAGATIGSVLGAALIALCFVWWARRMAWCCVHEGSRGQTPEERFESAELRSRPSSAIPHYHRSVETLQETSPVEENGNGQSSGGHETSPTEENANGESSGYPHTYLNVPRHLHVSPTPPGTPGTPATYATGRSDPWAIRTPRVEASSPPRSLSDDDAILPIRLDSRPESIAAPRQPSPNLAAPRPPQYATTTQRLGSRPVSLSDKASEMGVDSRGLPELESGRMRHSAPGTPRRRSSAEYTVPPRQLASVG